MVIYPLILGQKIATKKTFAKNGKNNSFYRYPSTSWFSRGKKRTKEGFQFDIINICYKFAIIHFVIIIDIINIICYIFVICIISKIYNLLALNDLIRKRYQCWHQMTSDPKCYQLMVSSDLLDI